MSKGLQEVRCEGKMHSKTGFRSCLLRTQTKAAKMMEGGKFLVQARDDKLQNNEFGPWNTLVHGICC